MTPIPETFTGTRDQRGYTFHLLKHSGDIALFEKWKPERPEHKRYEVVCIQQCPEKRWPDGRTTPAHEKFPKPEDWGVLGFSPYDREAAFRKFGELIEKVSKNRSGM